MNNPQNLYYVGKAQRLVNLVLLLYLTAYLGGLGVLLGLASILGEDSTLVAASSLIFALGMIALQIYFAIVVIRLYWALESNPVLRVILVLVVFLPCINLLALLRASAMATKRLREAGCKVGVLGVSRETLDSLERGQAGNA